MIDMAASPPLPAAFLPDAEVSRVLARFKASLVQRWRPTRMKELFESVDLAWFLLALGRRDETLTVASHLVDSVEHDPENLNLWSPVGYACCCSAYVHQLAGDERARLRALDPIRRYPFHADLDATTAQETLRELRADLAKATTETPTWARHYLARVCAKAAFLAETARRGSGFAWSGDIDSAPFVETIEAALAGLRERL
jgi:hypothetical protein